MFDVFPFGEPEPPKPVLEHWLTVHPYTEEDKDNGDLFDVEHSPDCPTVFFEDLECADYMCGVGTEVAYSGIETHFQHADDPDAESSDYYEHLKPGRYPIELWSVTHRGMDYVEYDGGLRVVQPEGAF